MRHSVSRTVGQATALILSSRGEDAPPLCGGPGVLVRKPPKLQNLELIRGARLGPVWELEPRWNEEGIHGGWDNVAQ